MNEEPIDLLAALQDSINRAKANQQQAQDRYALRNDNTITVRQEACPEEPTSDRHIVAAHDNPLQTAHNLSREDC